MRRTHSYSKREILDSCLRKYFYEYYASAQHTELDAKRKNEVRELKDLSNVFLLAGDRLHWLIEQRLKKPHLSRGWLERTCLAAFDKAVTYSRDPERNRQLAADPYPPPMLLEYFYRDAGAEDRADEARERLQRAINAFFDDQRITAIWQSVLQGTHWVERRIGGLAKVDDFAIDGKVDLAGKDNLGIKIIDWKLGAYADAHDSLQMAIYAGWARNEFGISAERVRVQRVFLSGPFIEDERAIDAKIVQRGRARVTQDIELMRELDPYGKSGNEEAFTPCKKENVCRQCKFQGICPVMSKGASRKQTFDSLPLFPEMA